MTPGGDRHGPLVSVDDVPDWLAPLVTATERVEPAMLRRLSPPSADGRDAAVLVLFAEHPEHGPDVLLQLRADGTNAHSGQVAFPGGATEPDDAGPVDTAVREAVEETGLDPSGVLPVALLPRFHIPVSNFSVTPVLAHWQRPSRVWAVDPAESAAVTRAPLSALADPANRFQVRHPSGYVGPAFALPGMLVWGFTAGLVSMVLRVGGWERPWDASDVRDVAQARKAVAR